MPLEASQSWFPYHGGALCRVTAEIVHPALGWNDSGFIIMTQITKLNKSQVVVATLLGITYET
jgi:hypothetical protein